MTASSTRFRSSTRLRSFPRLSAHRSGRPYFPGVCDTEEALVTATRGRVVRTPTEKKPYKVVLEHDGGPDTEQGLETVRECEGSHKGRDPRASETEHVA